MRERFVIVTIDTIVELLKDYCGQDIPADAMPLRLLLRPEEKGRLAIELTSHEFKPDSPSLVVNFRSKRIHAV